MKKILALVLAMLLAFGAVACSSDKDDEPTGKKTDTTQGDGEKGKGNGGDNGKKGGSTGGQSKTNKFALNPEYIGYIGKTKGEIDKLCQNTGKYNPEFGIVDYVNGLQIGFNTLGSM